MSGFVIDYVGREGVRTSRFGARDKPRHGDPILWALEDEVEISGAKAGCLGRIANVETGWCDPGEIHVCVGGSSVFLRPDGTTDISGGPFRMFRIADLTWTGRFETVRFWNWGDNPRGAGMGVDYQIVRPLWEITR